MKVGEEVEIVGFRETRKTVVTGVEMFKKLLDEGRAGDNVGLLLRGIEKDEVERGQVLVYHATYNRNPIIHRAVELDAHGWLMSGDSAPLSESWARVTRENYLGAGVLGYKNIEKNTL